MIDIFINGITSANTIFMEQLGEGVLLYRCHSSEPNSRCLLLNYCSNFIDPIWPKYSPCHQSMAVLPTVKFLHNLIIMLFEIERRLDTFKRFQVLIILVTQHTDKFLMKLYASIGPGTNVMLCAGALHEICWHRLIKTRCSNIVVFNSPVLNLGKFMVTYNE